MGKTKTVYVPRVRDNGKNPKHDGKAFRVRTHTNGAGQYGTRRWAEEAIKDALLHDKDLIRVGVGTEKIPFNEDADPDVWLKGDVKPASEVPTKYRITYVAMITAAANAARDSGTAQYVNESFRTYDEQNSFYQNYLNGGALAAAPGHSEHEFALALDIVNAWTQPKFAKALKKHGFKKTVPSEKWHCGYYPKG